MDYLILITFLLCLMHATASSSSLNLGKGNYLLTHRKMFPNPIQEFNESYANIFDAGSTGSRVHAYRFNHQLDLLHVGQDLELFVKVTINYLLGNLGKHYSKTVAVVDLGGGSVQMAYAVSETDAAKAPKVSDGNESYITEMFLKGKKYYLYVHSYLRYGLLAARAEVLKVSDDFENPCILAGFDGSYKYGGVEYKDSASPSGSSFRECKNVVLEALKINEICTHKNCTFGGIWNGGGGDGWKNFFVASFFFELADEAGFVDPNEPNAKVHPVDFEDAAKLACETELKDAQSTFPGLKDGDTLYICLDLVYLSTLLVDGFGIDPWQEITLVRQIQYQDSLVEAAWPLGSAIEAVSSLPKFEKLIYFI